MNFLYKILIGIIIWLIVIEIERTYGFAFFGSSIILILFLSSAITFLIFRLIPALKKKHVYPLSIKSSKFFGVLLTSVFIINTVYLNVAKHNFKLILDQVEIYKNEFGILPKELKDLPNPTSNVYGFLKHDFIYESEMWLKNKNNRYELKESLTDKVIGYKTPMGVWRYIITPNSESFDYIFYDD